MQRFDVLLQLTDCRFQGPEAAFDVGINATTTTAAGTASVDFIDLLLEVAQSVLDASNQSHGFGVEIA